MCARLDDDESDEIDISGRIPGCESTNHTGCYYKTKLTNFTKTKVIPALLRRQWRYGGNGSFQEEAY